MKKSKIEISVDAIPIESSLGLLAYGDVAFKAWRKRKIQENNKENEKE